MVHDWLQWIPTALRVAGEVFGGNGDGGGSSGPAPQPEPFFSGIGASSLNGDWDDVWNWPGENGNGDVFSPPSIPDISGIFTAGRDILRTVGSIFDGGNGIFDGGNGSSGAGGPDIDLGRVPNGGGGMMQVGALGAVGLPGIVAGAIGTLWVRLKGRAMGLTSASALAAYGRRIWAQITGWVQKNPGTSAIALLTGLGLTVDQAAHFLAWGATQKKRRRARGISGRDMKTTRSTMRKVISMAASLRQLCGAAVVRRGAPRHHHHFAKR